MTINSETDPIRLKEIGNEAFKSGDMDEALAAYTKAMDIAKEEKNREADLAVLFKNRAAVHLKNEQFQKAVDDCTKSLELVSTTCLLHYVDLELHDFPYTGSE